MTTIENFTIEHGQALSNCPDTVLLLYANCGEAYTALLEGKPVAAGGIILGMPGLGSVWAMITERAKTMPFMLHRQFARRLDDVIKRHKLRRVDYIVDPEKPENVTWCLRLGFRREGIMTAFYPDGHAALYCAWIAPEFREVSR